jgi:EAL domain-containing protein (putative c-di-GMP-specific phosphodiesterase class I)
VEALMRWQNPVLGLVSPVDFIPLAEENGMILAMGEWSFEESCRQMVEWHKQGLEHLTVAINISGKQLRLPHLPKIIAKILEKTGLAAKYIELELTESILIDDIENVVEMMYALKDMGLKLVIDDFGTGYSSLSYLKQFPVDKLKIDRSFIYEMASNENDAAIAKAIINLSHTLNLQVVAEGVETEFQKSFVVDHGCEFAQGYYFKPPDKPNKLFNFLKNYPEME